MENTKNNFLADLIPVVVMAILALTALMDLSKGDLSLAGLSTMLGFIFFFILKIRKRQSYADVGLGIKDFTSGIKKYWVIVLIPSLINLFCIILSKAVLPGYIDHVVGRTEALISFNKITLMTVEFIAFALIEEVSWRGFMQKQFGKYMNPAIAIFLTSIFFSIGHATKGDFVLVAYDVFFVFCNSLFYGLAYAKTKNIYFSALSHFLANFTGMLLLLFL